MAKKKIRNLEELQEELKDLQDRLDFSDFSFGEVAFNEQDLTFTLKGKTFVDQASREMRALANTLQTQSDFYVQVTSAKHYRKLLSNERVRAAVQQVVNPQVQPPVATQDVMQDEHSESTI